MSLLLLCVVAIDWLPDKPKVALAMLRLSGPSPSIRVKAQQKPRRAVGPQNADKRASKKSRPKTPSVRWTKKPITHLDGCLELEQNGLLDENLSGLCAKISNLVLHQLNLLAGTRASDLEQSVDDGVEINFFLIGHSSSSRDVRACWWPCGGRVLIKSDCMIIRVSFPKPCHGRVSWGGEKVW